MIKLLLSLVVFGRLVVPFLIFWNPFVAMILALFLDAVDGTLFYKAGFSWKLYNLADKILDYWWYVFIFVYSFRLNVFPIIFVLFLYRSVGQFLGMVSASENFYFWFPNILEKFFNLYIIVTVMGFKVDLSFNPLFVSLLMASLLIALATEWSIHVKKFYATAKFLYNTDVNWDKRK